MAPGQVIGPYVLEGKLAEGGMGEVWRATNSVTGAPRALKLMRPELAKKPDFVRRFTREAEIASRLRHRHLVETLEPGRDGTTLYLPMELLEGDTLYARMERGPLGVADTVQILSAVCAGVQALHDASLLHRDIKPLNVFLARTASGEVPKLIDFGTAREETDDEHTRTGMVVGSPHYMAPEQARGIKDLTGAVDQYAIGVMAYQMLTGARPYESDKHGSALSKLLAGEPYQPPSALVAGLPKALEAVILRALERAPERRFPSVTDLASALRAAADEPSGPEAVAPSGGLEATVIRDDEVAPRTSEPAPTPGPFSGAPPSAMSVEAPREPSPGAGFAMPPPRRTRRAFPVIPLAFGGLAVAVALAMFLVIRGTEDSPSPTAAAVSTSEPPMISSTPAEPVAVDSAALGAAPGEPATLPLPPPVVETAPEPLAPTPAVAPPADHVAPVPRPRVRSPRRRTAELPCGMESGWPCDD